MYVLGGKRQATKRYEKVMVLNKGLPLGIHGHYKYFLTEAGVIAVPISERMEELEHRPIKLSEIVGRKFPKDKYKPEKIYRAVGDLDEVGVLDDETLKKVKIVRKKKPGPKKVNMWVNFLKEYKKMPKIAESLASKELSYQDMVKQASKVYQSNKIEL